MSQLANTGTAQSRTLANQALPRRVKKILESALEFAAEQLESGLTRTLDEFEQQVFKFAEQARNNQVQSRWLEALRVIKRTRPDLIPRFLVLLEATLAGIRADEVVVSSEEQTSNIVASELSLVEESDMDEATVFAEITSRAEMRNSLPIYLLGQRFGVLAGKPAFDAEDLPIGPHSLCRMLKEAAVCLELSNEHRLLLFRVFERVVISDFTNFVDRINEILAQRNVLPHLQHASFRSKGSGQKANGGAEDAAEPETESASQAESEKSGGPRAPEPTMASRPRESLPWPGLNQAPRAAPPSGNPAQAKEDFGQIRDLLAGRRELISKLGSDKPGVPSGPQYVAPSEKVQSVLGNLQHSPNLTTMEGGKSVPRTVAHLKNDLLAQLRKSAPEDHSPALQEEDSDTFDLIGMLFDHLTKEIRPASPASSLLTKLQIPLLRVALDDKGFFTQEAHPARQMLNAVAETGAYWLSEEDADTALVSKMQSLVDRTMKEFDGDLGIFQSMLTDISGHLQTVARKAEVAERRHVDAAKGKEKLAVARENAAKAVEALTKGQNLPKFTHTLLTQAWTDVLALTALRNGEHSEQWKHQLGIAEQLVELAKPGAAKPEDSKELHAEVESALSQVGYHQSEAQAIAARLIDPAAEDDSGATSRTELSLKLKAKSRLGADVAANKKAAESLTSEEKVFAEQIKKLPFGSWIEFVTNQQGDKVRRRISWYSTVTGNLLLVNHRGQKVAEETIAGLSRLMAKKQAFIVEEKKEGLVDRAWNAVVSALKSFSGKAAPPEAEAMA